MNKNQEIVLNEFINAYEMVSVVSNYYDYPPIAAPMSVIELYTKDESSNEFKEAYDHMSVEEEADVLIEYGKRIKELYAGDDEDE